MRLKKESRTRADVTPQWLVNHSTPVGDCIEWNHARDDAGYGVLWVDRKPFRVHWLSCAVSHGEPAVDQVARHSCDNPPCINPDHLSWGTQAQNVRDYWDGVGAVKRKLTWEAVREIRAARAAGASTYALALLHSVNRGTISRICRNLIWKELP